MHVAAITYQPQPLLHVFSLQARSMRQGSALPAKYSATVTKTDACSGRTLRSVFAQTGCAHDLCLRFSCTGLTQQ